MGGRVALGAGMAAEPTLTDVARALAHAREHAPEPIRRIRDAAVARVANPGVPR